MVVGYVGAYLTITYLRGHYDARTDSLWNYLLPVTVVQVRRVGGGWGREGLEWRAGGGGGGVIIRMKQHHQR